MNTACGTLYNLILSKNTSIADQAAIDLFAHQFVADIASIPSDASNQHSVRL